MTVDETSIIYTSSLSYLIIVAYYICFIDLGNGVDYVSGPYYILFPIGVVQGSFNLLIIDDNIVEEIETLNLIINASALHANVSTDNITGQALVTILDNDSKLSYISSISSVAVLLL